MGRGMVHCLMQAGHEVTVWNRTTAKAHALEAEGAKVASDLEQLAQQCSVIFICISNTDDVVEIVLGEHGMIHHAHPDTLIVDMSTISPDVTRDIQQRLQQRGISMLDAPVSGGSEGAQNGTLSIMVGGEATDYERALPFFQAMGRTITHVGPHGAGQTAKLVNQILVVGNMLAVSEALVFAQAGGLDLDRTLEAVSGGAAGSWMLRQSRPAMHRS